MLRAIALASTVTIVSGTDRPVIANEADLRRANQPRPYEGSTVLSDTPRGAFSGMADVLRRQGVATQPCTEWSLPALDKLQSQLMAKRDPWLNMLYKARNDRRALHFDPSSDHKAVLSKEEQELVAGSMLHNNTRDGKCAESVMWWTHHLPHTARKELMTTAGFTLPEPPQDVAQSEVGREYVYQIQCTSCHIRKSNESDPPPPSGPPKDTCTTGTWYEGMNASKRLKRCDWDYTPAPRPCEGIGGIIWGDGEGEFHPTTCTVVMNASDIPKDNITSPIWPEQFSVQEQDVFINQKSSTPTTSGRFPGADPCAGHKFLNVTYAYTYDGSKETGPRSKVDGHDQTGKLLRVWQEQTGNMYIENYESSWLPFACICVGPQESGEHDTKGPVIGALEHDFCKDCILVGREKIGVEFPTMHEVVADHWNKGPHHFWVDVATNTMVRGWQPYNALNVWYNWTVGPQPESSFALTDGCKSTNPIVDVNVGKCRAPHPSSA